MKSYWKSEAISIIGGVALFIIAIVLICIGEIYIGIDALSVSVIWLLISRIDYNSTLLSDQKKEIEDLKYAIKNIEINVELHRKDIDKHNKRRIDS